MKLFESERKVMEVLWREGSISAGQVAKILNLETGWNRNTTYTVINKCIRKGYVSRSEGKFICTPILTKKEACNEELNELLEKYYDGQCVKMFDSLVKISTKQEIKKMKKILKNN